MIRAAIAAAAVSLLLAGCGGGSKEQRYDASATKACLDRHDRTMVAIGRSDARLAPLGVAGEDATGILWSPTIGVLVFARDSEEARQVRRQAVEFSRRNANAMTPGDPSELATSVTIDKNVVALWRDRRPREREVVLGCLR